MIEKEYVTNVYKILNSVLLKKKKYNLISDNTWSRYAYGLKRLYKYLYQFEFENFDEFVLKIMDWKTNSTISDTIRKKYLDVAFTLIIEKERK